MLNKKSEANLEIAKFCLDKKDENFFAVGVSRAYIAIFQATKGLLVKRGVDYKKFELNDPSVNNQRDYVLHGTIRRALKYFLQTNGFNNQEDLRFINDINPTFSKLYFWRLRGDYEDATIYKKNLEDVIEITERFISELKKYDW